MRRTIIGVDLAASPVRAGCALASFVDGRTAVSELRAPSSNDDPVAVVAEWICSSSDPSLIALDAPLGWPVPLGEMLLGHRAGQAPSDEAETLFGREADRFVSEMIGTRPLEMIAGRIAAYAALSFLDDVREYAGAEIPLTWKPDFEGPAAIEVYPAATLRAYHIAPGGYEHSAETDLRYNIAVALRDRIKLPRDIGQLVGDADVLDAAVCVLAAHDFLNGRAFEPEDQDLARREGWIWVRNPDYRPAA